MNACTKYLKPECVHGAKRVSLGTCNVCPSYAPGPLQWADVRVKGRSVTKNLTNPSVKQVQPVPRAEWPMAARIVSKLATKDDKGIGSTIHRLAGKVGEMWEWAFEAIAKKPCGCKDRAKWLDERYTY